MARQTDLLHLDRGQLAARQLGDGTALRQERHTHFHLDGALDGLEARQRHLDVDRRVLQLKRAQHTLARGRRIVVRDDGFAAELGQRDILPAREGVLRVDEHHQIIRPERQRHQAALGRQKGHHAEVQAPLRHLDANLPRGYAPHVDLDVRMLVAESPDQRQQRVHGTLVGADQDPSAAQVAQLAHGGLGLFAEAHQALRVVAQDAAGLGEGALLRGSVEQALAKLLLEAPNGLAHGWLRAVELGGRAREAALGGDGQKDLQFGQFHQVRLSAAVAVRDGGS